MTCQKLLTVKDKDYMSYSGKKELDRKPVKIFLVCDDEDDENL